MPKDGRLVLADFGLTKEQSRDYERHTNNVVTQWYRAPELLMGATEYGFEVDVWAAGCVIAEMFTSKPLFAANDKDERRQLDLIWGVCGICGSAANPSSSADWPVDLERRLREEMKRRRPGGDERILTKMLLASAASTSGKDPTRRPSLLTARGSVSLNDGMLVTPPRLRPTVTQALAHPYFVSQEPKPYTAGQFFVER